MDTIETPFSSFGLSENMLKAIAVKGWAAPTPIQSIALPRLLANEDHLIVKARTGTGKTAAFGIPLIEKLTQAGHAPKALILTPTRELALQVSKEIASLVSGSYPRVTAVYGGASIRGQILDLRRGTEIVVGTPGRIMDLQERKALDLSVVDWFILDEADEMLDMGFFEDVEKIFASVKQGAGEKAAPAADSALAAPQQAPRQVRVALFSATMPDAILRIVRKYIGEVEILHDAAPEDEKPAVDQFFIVVKREDKLEALRRLIDQAASFYGLIFCGTKVETDELARRLIEAGYPAEAIHGDLSQEIRERTMRRFRLHRASAESGAAILVATDVAARGLDIEALTHVINWDLPNDRETYVHRVGRTGRAGRRGIAVSLALPSERGRISQLSRNMERTLGSGIQWLSVPSVKSVMKAVRRRIVSRVVAALPAQDAPPAEQAFTAEQAVAHEQVTEAASAAPDSELNAGGMVLESAAPTGIAPAEAAPASPFLAKLYRELIEKMGAEQALAAMVTLNYGDMLDPDRFGPVAEFSENDFFAPGRGFASKGGFAGGGREEHGRRREGRSHSGGRAGPAGATGQTGRAGKSARFKGGRARGDFNGSQASEGLTRLYVGLGRRHGANARDVAGLLMKAGGVPGRMVDEIEMQAYCSFATLPSDAAKRACSFSHKDTVIRPAASR
jgi:ATP-dependent RNA helicase DeaD